MRLVQRDRRASQRYDLSAPAELVTGGERHECALIDISPIGASLVCLPIANDAPVSLHIAGFGALKAARVRSANGVERLVFREAEAVIRDFTQFLTRMVEAGAASLAEACKMEGLKLHGPDICEQELSRRVDQALSLTQQISDGLPPNVALFPMHRSHSGRRTLLASTF